VTRVVPGRLSAVPGRLTGLLIAASIGARAPAVRAPVDVAAPWLLIAPPYYYRDGGARMADRAPLWDWVRLGGFPDAVACRDYRDDRIAHASGDEEWAVFSKSRCETAERAAGARLTPDELTTQ
jgi:hypothetical protein